MKEYDVKGFKYVEVIKHCDEFDDTEEQVKYLNYVLYKWMNDRPELDPNGGMVPNFEERIKRDIEYREKFLDSDGTEKTSNDKIIWAKNRQDFAALFDLLIQLGFISYRRKKWEMLCEHFTWNDGEMTPKQLKDALSNINHNSETHKTSDEISLIMDVLRKMKSS